MDAHSAENLNGTLQLFPKNFTINSNDFDGKPVLDRGKTMVTGAIVGFNFAKLQKAVASMPPFWAKNTKWSQIRLKNFYINFKEGSRSKRIVFGATLRYETFTKDFIHFWGRGRRWRTASVTAKMRGSMAIKLDPVTGTMQFYDFKADSIRVKNIPPWLEEWTVRRFVNTAIRKSFKLDMRVGGLNTGDIQLQGINRRGDFLFFTIKFRKPVNVARAISSFRGFTFPQGMNYAPVLKQVKQKYISTENDLKQKNSGILNAYGKQNYGFEIEFEKNPATREVHIDYSYDGRRWRPNTHPGLDRRNFKQYILGDHRYNSQWGTKKSLRPDRPVYIRARYRFSNGQFSRNYFKKVFRTDAYALPKPKIERMEYVNTKKYGTVLKIFLKKYKNRTRLTFDTTIYFDGRRQGGSAGYLQRKTFLDRYHELPGKTTNPSYSISDDGDEITIYPGSVLGTISGYRTEEFNGIPLKGNWPIYSFSKTAKFIISYKLTYPTGPRGRMREAVFATGPRITVNTSRRGLDPLRINQPSLKKATASGNSLSLLFSREQQNAPLEVELRKMGDKTFSGKWPTEHWTDDINKPRRHNKNRYSFYFKEEKELLKGRVSSNRMNIRTVKLNGTCYVRARYIIDKNLRGTWSRPIRFKASATAAGAQTNKFNLYKTLPAGFSMASGASINNGDRTGSYATLQKKEIAALADGQSFTVDVLGGRFRYVTVCALKGGRKYSVTKTSSKTLNKALFRKSLQDRGITSFAVYVNGDQRSFMKERCAIRLLRPKAAAAKFNLSKSLPAGYESASTPAVNNGIGGSTYNPQAGKYGTVNKNIVLSLPANDSLFIDVLGGSYRYIKLYAFYKNMRKRQVYGGSGRTIPKRYLERLARDRNVKSFIYYVNGDNNKYLKVPCAIRFLKKKSSPSSFSYNRRRPVPRGYMLLSTRDAVNNGRSISTGIFSRESLLQIQPGEKIRVDVLGGRFQYLSIYASLKNGRRIKAYQQGNNPQFAAGVLQRYRNDDNVRYFEIFINGDEKGRQNKPCAIRLLRQKTNTADMPAIPRGYRALNGFGENNGRGGGRPLMLRLSDVRSLQGSQRIVIQRVSGRLRYATIIVKFKNGRESVAFRGTTLYAGALKKYESNTTVSMFLAYPNWYNRRYDRVSCKIRLLIPIRK